MRDVDADARCDDFDEPKVNGLGVRGLRYADDTTLLSKSDNGLDSLITTVKEHSESKNLKLNVKKTKIMDVKGCSAPSIISVNCGHVENVEFFIIWDH